MNSTCARRYFLKLAGFGLAGAVLFPRVGKTDQRGSQGLDKARPNVLFSISDDQGFSDFGFMGNSRNRIPLPFIGGHRRLGQHAVKIEQIERFARMDGYSPSLIGPNLENLIDILSRDDVH